MPMFRVPRARYLRNRLFSRVRHSEMFENFISEMQTDLDATGTEKAFVLGTNAYGATASGTLTATGQPAAAGTVTVGTVTYTFVSALTDPDVANEVLIGANFAATLANLAAAINGSAGAGTTYGVGTVANAGATATSDATTVVLRATALLQAAGNTVATTEAATNMSFGAATLTGGADPTNKLTVTTHGYDVGEGPFLLATSDTLPGGLEAGQFYFINSVVDANNVTLKTAFDDNNVVEITSAGTGTHSITKASSLAAIFHYLKRNPPAVVASATDVDSL